MLSCGPSWAIRAHAHPVLVPCSCMCPGCRLLRLSSPTLATLPACLSTLAGLSALFLESRRQLPADLLCGRLLPLAPGEPASDNTPDHMAASKPNGPLPPQLAASQRGLRCGCRCAPRVRLAQADRFCAGSHLPHVRTISLASTAAKLLNTPAADLSYRAARAKHGGRHGSTPLPVTPHSLHPAPSARPVKVNRQSSCSLAC